MIEAFPFIYEKVLGMATAFTLEHEEKDIVRFLAFAILFFSGCYELASRS